MSKACATRQLVDKADVFLPLTRSVYDACRVCDR
jgi:hypothetical protein